MKNMYSTGLDMCCKVLRCASHLHQLRAHDKDVKADEEDAVASHGRVIQDRYLFASAAIQKRSLRLLRAVGKIACDSLDCKVLGVLGTSSENL